MFNDAQVEVLQIVCAIAMASAGVYVLGFRSFDRAVGFEPNRPNTRSALVLPGVVDDDQPVVLQHSGSLKMPLVTWNTLDPTSQICK